MSGPENSRHFLDQLHLKLKAIDVAASVFPSIRQVVLNLNSLDSQAIFLTCFQLAAVIALDLVLRHSIEKRSIFKDVLP